MPSTSKAHHTLLAVLFLVPAACAPEGRDKFSTAPQSQPSSPSVAAVQAFAHICGRLEEGEVLSRAVRYGFTPIPPERLAQVTNGAMRDASLRVLMRPTMGAPAMVFWAPQRRSCELGVGGVEPAAVEAEFNRLISALAAEPNLSVTDVPTEGDRATARLRRAVIVSPRALVQSLPRALSLRVNETPGLAMQASLAAAPLAPQGAATPPPSLGPMKQ